MKKARKFLSLLLAMAMVMAMSLTSFAAQKTEVDLSDNTFKAYQIFNATSITESKELGNLTWGTGITEAGKTALLTKYGVDSVPALAKKLAAFGQDSVEARAFAQEAYKYVTGEGAAITSGVTKLPLGYYIVVDVTDEADAEAYNLSILKVSDADTAIEIATKVDVPSVDKEILDPIEKKDNEAAIGETVNYQITGTMPSNLADYEAYYYWFKDTLSAGLDYNNDAEVYVVNGDSEKEVTDYFYKNATVTKNATGTVTGTVIDIAIQDVIALNLLADITVDKDTKIVVRYSAVVNEDAVIAREGNPNKVDLEYSNNPDNNGTPTNTPPGPNPPKPTKNYPTGTTPEDKVVTYVTELTIIKIDQNENVLTGAEFTLTGTNLHTVKVKTGDAFVADPEGTYYKLKDGTYTTEAPQAEEKDGEGNVTVESNLDLYVAPVEGAYEMYAKKTIVETTGAAEADKSVSAFVDAEGKITFSGLGAGDYTIEETVVPEGYNKAENIRFTISYENGAFTDDSADIEVGDVANTFKTTIENKNGATLPETGGIGTKMFYLIGSLLVLAAGVLLITKRRMAK